MDLQDEKKELVHSIRKLLAMNPPKDLQGKIEDLLQDINKDVYTIVVLGEFKRGKSTFINALLGKSLLPMDVLPETAAISLLHYGEKPNAVIYYNDGHMEQGKPSYDYLKKFSAGSEHEQSGDVKYIDISYPLDILKDNIALVDTPGVSDINEQRCAITYGIIPKANAVLFLLDSASPLKKTEYQFIEGKLLDIGVDNIIFIANHYDLVDEDDEEDFLDDLYMRLQNAFIKDGKQQIPHIELWPLSALMALQGEETGNEMLVKESGMNEVRMKLQKVIHNGTIERQKIESYKKRASYLYQQFYRQILNQIDLYNTDIDSLHMAQKQLQKVFDESVQNKASISTYIKTIKPIMYSITDKSISYFHQRIREDTIETVNAYKGTDFKSYVEDNVSRQVRNQFENWIGSYNSSIEMMLRKLEIELSRGMSYFFRQNICV